MAILETNLPGKSAIVASIVSSGFCYRELTEDGAFISAQLAGHEIVYSAILTQARNSLSCEDVEVISSVSFRRSRFPKVRRYHLRRFPFDGGAGFYLMILDAQQIEDVGTIPIFGPCHVSAECPARLCIAPVQWRTVSDMPVSSNFANCWGRTGWLK